MNTCLPARKITPNALFLLCLVSAVMVLLSVGQTPVQAQSPVDWSSPVNLSNSGSSSDPQIVVDSKNRIHTIWQDEFAGYRYSQSTDGITWSQPVSVAFIFDQYQPHFYRGSGDYIYAFWVDSRGNLLASRFLSNYFNQPGAWEYQGILAASVKAFDFSVDEQEIYHLVYATSDESLTTPSGIYYRQTLKGGASWRLARQVTTSLYFRNLTQDTASVSVATRILNDTKTIFAAWVDPYLKQFSLSTSTDDGNSWEEHTQQSTSLIASGLTQPDTVELAVWNDQIISIWQDKSSETICSVQYQILAADSQIWSAPDGLYSGEYGCPTSVGFIITHPDFLVWQMSFASQSILYAWNGIQWSTPEAQTDLTRFTDPSTDRALAAGCVQLTSSPSHDKIYSVICDTNGNNDIWFSSRDAGDSVDWFQNSTTWSRAQELVSSESPVKIDGLSVVADSMGNFHSFWITASGGTEGTIPADSQAFAIYYSRWSSGSWSAPIILRRSAPGNMRDLSVAISKDDEIYLTWRGIEPAKLYFTKTLASRAYSLIEWSEPTEIPSLPGRSSSASLVAGDDDTVFVVYAVPVNDNRGIYIVRSTDQGQNWDDPQQIFNAQSAGWDLVDQPKLVITKDGRLHCLWLRKVPLEESTGVGIGYAYSDDQGAHWSEAEQQLSTENIQWADLIIIEPDRMLRVWYGLVNNREGIYSQVSLDLGQSWQAPVSIIRTDRLLGNPVLVSNSASGARLLQLVESDPGRKALHEWIWANNIWEAGDTLQLDQSSARTYSSFAGEIAAGNDIAVVIAAADAVEARQSVQALVKRQTGLGFPPAVTPQPTQAQPETSATLEAVITAEPPTSTTEEPPTLTPSITPTIDISNNNNYPRASTNTWTGLIIGSVFAILIIAGLLIIRALFSKTKK